MPNKESHLAAARRNQKLINRLILNGNRHPEWVAVVAFYKALHIIEAVLFVTHPSRHGGNHDDRNQILKTTNKYKNLYTHYRPLYSASLVARYLEDERSEFGCFENYMSGQDVVNKLLKFRLHELEKSAAKIIGDLGLPPAPEPESSGACYVAMYLHGIARSHGEQQRVRELIHLAIREAQDFYGLPAIGEEDNPSDITTILGEFAAEWDEAERRAIQNEQESKGRAEGSGDHVKSPGELTPSPDMIRAAYFLAKFREAKKDELGRLPPREFGVDSWRRAYKRLHRHLGAGMRLSDFQRSMDDLRRSFRTCLDRGNSVSEVQLEMLGTWYHGTGEELWPELQKFVE